VLPSSRRDSGCRLATLAVQAAKARERCRGSLTRAGLCAKHLLGPARVTAQEYDAYLSGSQQAVAIYLRDVSVLNEPITLDHIRQSRAWHPPQTWHFLHPDHLADLVGNHMALSQLQIALEGFDR